MKSDNAVGLARGIADVYIELGNYGGAAVYAQKALESMQQVGWIRCAGGGMPRPHRDGVPPVAILVRCSGAGEHAAGGGLAGSSIVIIIHHHGPSITCFHTSTLQVVGGFHPALQPYYELLQTCLQKSGDDKVRTIHH